VTAPAGGIEQVIEGANIEGGSFTLNWTGTATATINGTSIAKGANTTLPANTNATVRFTGGTVALVQLEAGTVATPFEQRQYGQEITICQRYYETGLAYIRGYFGSGSFTLGIHVPYKVPKRTSSTITFSSTTYLNASSVSAGANTNLNSFVALANVTTGGTDTFLNTAWAAESEL
jgi:hypothetical protein